MRQLLLICVGIVVGTIAYSSSRQVHVGRSVVCYDTSSSFLMRDTTSSCGRGTAFCSTPLRCYSTSTGQYLGGSIATCRALNNVNRLDDSAARATGVGAPTFSCPDLQNCADDTRQEFIEEREGWRWLDSTISFGVGDFSQPLERGGH